MEQMQELKILEDFLKEKKMHLTRPRKVILQVFLQSSSHMEVEELYEKAKKVDKEIGIATVYRTMNLLVECGLAQENVLFEDKKCFERVYGRKHHDHLVCTKCKKVKEFHHPLIERSQEKIAEKHQFTIISHHMTLFGVCQNCK
jgi:Fur family ferric uptake transcriptional regulator